MPSQDIFISVGSGGNEQQEEFVAAIYERLKAEGLNPRTLGRTDWSSDAPLKPIKAIIEECVGAVIIALERSYFPSGVVRRGHATDEIELLEVSLPTPWNQIEAALAFSKGLPLLVIVQEGLLKEGLIEPRHDWFVQTVKVEASTLASPQFTGILSDWKSKLASEVVSGPLQKTEPGLMTVGELLKALRPRQLWSVFAAGAAALGFAFALGAKFFSQ